MKKVGLFSLVVGAALFAGAGPALALHCSAVFSTNIAPFMAQPNGTFQIVSQDCTGDAGCNDYFDITLLAGDTLNLTFCSNGGTATFDTALSVWDGPGFGTLRVCNDDFCGLLSQVTFVAPADGIYRVRVGGFGAASGRYTLAYRAPAGSRIDPRCGDGVFDPPLGEQCDEGANNGMTTSCCSLTCQFESARTTCDDGDACTQINRCDGAGNCVGLDPVACTASDQCRDPGTCDPATGGCSNPAKPDGTACNDGKACTPDDTCQGGVCGGTPLQCTPPDQCHDAACNAATGKCEFTHKPNGTACDDGSACTRSDTCQAGVCTGANPVVCSAPDQCHEQGICDPAAGTCSNPERPDGTTCSDGNACTRTDTCRSGVCTGVNPVVCTASDQCHDAGTCDSATGTCSNPEKPNDTACDDSDLCTGADTCQAGNCTGSDPVVCSALNQCHEVGVCDPSTGTCTDPHKADGSACDDEDTCTRTDTCRDGTCRGSDPVICVASDQCHEVGTCDLATGVCSDPPKAGGTSCEDGDPCTAPDTCEEGVCMSGGPVVLTGDVEGIIECAESQLP